MIDDTPCSFFHDTIILPEKLVFDMEKSFLKLMTDLSSGKFGTIGNAPQATRLRNGTTNDVVKHCIAFAVETATFFKKYFFCSEIKMALECTHISAPYISLLILKNVWRNIYKYSRDVEIRRVCMNLHSYL